MDWVFDHANALAQVASILAAALGFAFYLRSELFSLRHDVSQIKDHQRSLMESLTQINTILTQIAVQDTRLNMIEKDIDEIRHGKGFIS